MGYLIHSGLCLKAGSGWCLAGDVPGRLALKVGCPVLLRKNIDTSKGLINGQIGVVSEVALIL